jgi:large subunit ribosomal protein L20
MPRVRKGAATRRMRKRILKAASGFRGQRSRQYRLAKEAIARGGAYAFRDRRQKKREYRGLWIIRLGAACKSRDIRYSQFIYGLKLAQISINRKMLSEMAIHDVEGFDKVVDIAKKAIA